MSNSVTRSAASCALILASIIVVTGCATTQDFDCEVGDTSEECRSARDVYNITSHGGRVQDYDPDAVQPSQYEYDPRFTQPYVEIDPDRPTPIRTPTRTMRIYVSSYEDQRTQMLVAPHYLFQDIEDRTWVLGDENVTQTRPVGTPLQAD